MSLHKLWSFIDHILLSYSRFYQNQFSGNIETINLINYQWIFSHYGVKQNYPRIHLFVSGIKNRKILHRAYFHRGGARRLKLENGSLTNELQWSCRWFIFLRKLSSCKPMHKKNCNLIHICSHNQCWTRQNHYKSKSN